MGHSTAIIELTNAELTASPSPRFIMDTAVRKWYDEEAERYSDARHVYTGLSPISSERVARLIIDGDEEISTSKIVPLTNDYSEKTATVRLEVTASELAALRRGSSWQLLEAGRFGKNVTAVEIIQLPKLRAPRAEATEGKVTTLYKVVDAHRYPVRELKPSYGSQAEARAAAIEYMKVKSGCSELSVEAFIQREGGGSALVRITRPEPETSTVTFKITTQTAKPKAKIVGYLVSFDYHH